MRAVRTALFGILVVLIASTGIIGQVAFRLERTYMSYRYGAVELDAILAPLDNQEIHEDAVDELFKIIRKQMDVLIPIEMQRAVSESAQSGFSTGWIKDLVRRGHLSLFRVMRGKDEFFSLVVNIGAFKRALTSRVYDSFRGRYADEISKEMRNIPESINLGREIPEETQTKIVTWVRNLPVITLLLQYALPSIFILLCFAFGKPGSALLTIGAGLLLSGFIMAVLCIGFSSIIGDYVARAAGSSLPSAFSWLKDGISTSISNAFRGGVSFAILLSFIGITIGAGGMIVIRKWGDSFTQVFKRSDKAEDEPTAAI